MTLYEQTVPVFTRMLDNLSAMLDKAQAHAAAAKYEVAVLLEARLFPDMFPLTRQVQLATDFAKGCCARLVGQEVPRWEDTEKTLPELQARLRKTLDYLAGFLPAQFDDAATRAIELKTPAGSFHFTGDSFVQTWALPNFYFHVTTAYNLLRHNGVPVGKLDFLGKF
ncbi:MAG TPA: DUF1993 domain-containing protein [Gammaproteobacteria bacterium]|nr:DUF1993 domain-containing protein [Gammaproteobacteria bacterium]